MGKKRTKTSRNAVAKMRLRELLYAMLQAASGSSNIDDELLGDIPQAIGSDEWIRWLNVCDGRFGMWRYCDTADVNDEKLFGRFLCIPELTQFTDFNKVVDRLFEAGARA